MKHIVHAGVKIFLFVILCLFAVELSLHLSGRLLLVRRDFLNAQKLGHTGTFVILALGESTTANLNGDNWPELLERILNDRYLSGGKKFTVINKGQSSVNSWMIVSKLNQYLDTYHPDMVISMMGVNDEYGYGMYAHDFIPSADKPTIAGNQKTFFFRNIKVYRLAETAYNMVKRFIDKPDTQKAGRVQTKQFSEEQNIYEKLKTDPNNTEYLHMLGVIYQNTQRMNEAERIYTKLLLLNPLDTVAVGYLSQVYNQTGRTNLAKAILQKAVTVSPNDPMAYLYLADFYSYYKQEPSPPFADYAAAESYYKKALSLGSDNPLFYLRLGRFYQQMSRADDAKKIYEKAHEIFPNDPQVALLLGDLTDRMGDSKGSATWYATAQMLRPATQTNYDILRRIVLSRGIRFVAVQYPMRNIGSLHFMLGLDNSAPLALPPIDSANTTIVDNEQSFLSAVARDGYDAYFTDRFAGDFGHATPKGNEMLADNIADALITVFGKQ